MEIKVQKATFKKAVSSARRALSKVVIQEERSHLLCRVSGLEMTIQATNNDLKAFCRIPLTENKGNENFSFTVDPKVIEKLFAKIDTSEVRIQYDPKDAVVKVYTTDSGKSFTSLQGFNPDKMLTFEGVINPAARKHTINKAVFVFTLNYAENFLSGEKEDQKQYDFITINNGVVFSANGMNKMGFIVFKVFEPVTNYRIRKLVAPMLLSFTESLEGSEIVLFETDKDYGVSNTDGSMYYSFLKSNIEPVPVPKEHIKSEGPYVTVEKNQILKVTDRLMASTTTSMGAGVELVLSDKGDTARIDISLVSDLKSTESVPCVRCNDESDQDVSHVLDYRLLKSILNSFSSDKPVRLHINDDKIFFKIYNSGEVEGNKYVLAGIGSYAKIKRT